MIIYRYKPFCSKNSTNPPEKCRRGTEKKRSLHALTEQIIQQKFILQKFEKQHI